MSSADAEVVVRDFIRSRGGTASAGEVVAHAATLGLAASTVRRAADQCVEKVRAGNRFVWTLMPEPEPEATTDGGDLASMERSTLEARARDLGIELDPSLCDWSEVEIAALIEDAEDGFIEPAPLPKLSATWY